MAPQDRSTQHERPRDGTARHPGPADNPLTSTALAAIQRTSAVDTVRARISLAVDLGLLAPGERLPNIPTTAAALGVAEITVRRALSALEREGVVTRRPGRGGGTFIAERPRAHTVPQVVAYTQDSARVHRLVDERAVLETGFAHLAATRRDPDALAVLDACVAAMDEAETWADFHTADKRFHLGIAHAAGLPQALEIYGRVTRELYPYFLPYPMAYLRESNEEHRQLRAALADHDPARAGQLAHEHVCALHRTMYVGLTAEETGE
ncbi:FadR/GntR family transcriptional regulator [Streptomyces boncukensis]|uniref:FadR family transcriptional regulator n=1 Tax=Streptomyces boncukensis TaxID=2711219 RepID=A0A6G4X4N8_9ACTN|nr:FCD domain-containing protein [Streptomyces boncukensis]NGO72496.1 FadR family transcriptional regulator [Streptomyces boncukensis]